ncbi:hypothetical protein HDE_06436 [Halotydeus destructor]|nr:hypothetical protein HDE_06436 [Halotydeus destructor]
MAGLMPQNTDHRRADSCFNQLSADQKVKIMEQVARVVDDAERQRYGQAAVDEANGILYESIASKCLRHPEILTSAGNDIVFLALHWSPFFVGEAQEAENIRCANTYPGQYMTPREKATAYYQNASFTDIPPPYSIMLEEGQFMPTQARRLARFRPGPYRVPMADLARIPEAPPGSDHASDGYPSATNTPRGSFSAYDAEGSPTRAGSPGQAGGQGSPGSAGGSKGPVKRFEDLTEEEKKAFNDRNLADMKAKHDSAMAEAEKARIEEQTATSRAISAFLDEVLADPVSFIPPASTHLMEGLPEEQPEHLDNFYDWLHASAIPYDAALDELPGKTLVSPEGHEVQVPEYNAAVHGGAPFHQTARRTGLLRATVREEMEGFDQVRKALKKFQAEHPEVGRKPPHKDLSKLKAKTHPGLHPGKTADEAMRGNWANRTGYRASSVPATERDRAAIRPHYPHTTPAAVTLEQRANFDFDAYNHQVAEKDPEVRRKRSVTVSQSMNRKKNKKSKAKKTKKGRSHTF